MPQHEQGASQAANGHEPLSKRKKLLAARQQLPIRAVQRALVERVRASDVLVLVGETGSGKTTQVPQILMRAGLAEGSCIVCTQPRRVAAITVALRVAQEQHCRLGDEVGYAIRFEDHTSAATRIKYVTDGMLLREALLNPQLTQYKIIILDEAHERTVQTDVLVGLLRGVGAALIDANKHSYGLLARCRSLHHLRSCPKLETLHQVLQYTSGLHRQGDPCVLCRCPIAPICPEPYRALGHQPCLACCSTSAHLLQAKRRGSLKLIIMSATLDASAFAEAFPGAQIIYVQGRQHPVQILYTAVPQDSYLDAALTTVLQLHAEEQPGDILVFLTGEEEIHTLQRLLRDKAPEATDNSTQQLVTATLYAAQSSEEQLQAFKPAAPGTRKVTPMTLLRQRCLQVILATNIAETSVTVSGVRYVVDSGMVKSRAYSPAIGAESLQVIPVSQAQARQRAGRAGREQPGKAFRLYTEAAFRQLAPTTLPEIQRSNLAAVVLQLKALGVNDVANFPFMDKPSPAVLVRALEHLLRLGALDSNGKLTAKVGKPLAALPLEPRFGRALLAAADLGCLQEAVAVIALASGPSVFHTPRNMATAAREAHAKFSSPLGDHVTLLNVWKRFQACPSSGRKPWCFENCISLRAMTQASAAHQQLLQQMLSQGCEASSCGDNMVPLQKALLQGLMSSAARHQGSGKA
eukprot:jgi/Astpho2/5414/Aster-07365